MLLDFSTGKCFEEFDTVNLTHVVRKFCRKQNSVCSFTLTELLCKLDLMLRLEMNILD